MEPRYTIHENEPDQTVILHLEKMEDEMFRSIPVIRAAIGGEILWEDSELVKEVPDDVFDNFERRYSEAPMALPSDIVGKLRRLANLNKETWKLQNELIEAMDERYDLGLADDCGILSPLEDLTPDDFVYGEVRTFTAHNGKERKGLYVDGKLVGTEVHPGYYVGQHAGYCEDSYHGVMYLKMWGDGRYVKIPFET